MAKDQSYFLWQLGQDECSRTLFPIGELTKTEVRVLARKFRLPNAEKPDSQGLCFVGDVSMEEFLARFIPLAPGAVIDTAGKRIGEHHGAALYTTGQRHGFILHHSEVRETSSPQYVVAVDTKQNIVKVSANRSDAFRTSVTIRNLNWICGTPEFPLECEAQTRYRETPVIATITSAHKGVTVSFAEPHLVSPGQSLVLYSGDRCLGGGIIDL